MNLSRRLRFRREFSLISTLQNDFPSVVLNTGAIQYGGERDAGPLRGADAAQFPWHSLGFRREKDATISSAFDRCDDRPGGKASQFVVIPDDLSLNMPSTCQSPLIAVETRDRKMRTNEELVIGRDDSTERRERILKIQRFSFPRDQTVEPCLAVALVLAYGERRHLTGAAGRVSARIYGAILRSAFVGILLFHLNVIR